MDKELIVEELIQYYEAAGFVDVYNKKIKNLSDEELFKFYQETFE